VWWENEFLRVRRRRLYLGQTSALTIAARRGTPLFVYGRARLLSNYQTLKRTFSKYLSHPLRIAYAMKANPHRGILSGLRRQGAWIDAVSPQEVEEARRAGYPGGKILFTGTSLSAEDLGRVFRVDGLTVNVDALEQLELMREIKNNGFRGKRIRVSIRWNPGIGRGFNPKVITAGVRSSDGTPIKFGIEAGKVMTALERAASYGFSPVGLHQHLGSGWANEDFGVVSAAVEKMVAMALRVQKEGFRLEFLDFGGGFGPRYGRSQKTFPLARYASHIARTITESGLRLEAVVIEPGKYLVADAGVLLLRVEYLKESYGQLFACVNAGTFNSIPRPAIYPQARHHVVHCGCVYGGRMRPLTVAGNLCETGDVFAREILMPVPQRGDFLAVLHAGAYCRSMASQFNLREIPKEVIV
jgi:diaminopimelate decarboxylase